ncbi:MAG: hypothetical protein P4L10_13025 [Acidobacteriaceae bacterium]|nr:hypothetical protein [Acidobacteriaceae bacterium]
MQPNEAKSDFYMKSTEDNSETIEIMDNFEMTNEFKQHVCLPYFKDLHKAGLQSHSA